VVFVFLVHNFKLNSGNIGCRVGYPTAADYSIAEVLESLRQGYKEKKMAMYAPLKNKRYVITLKFQEEIK